MNAARRKRLTQILEAIEAQRDALEEIAAEEREAFDNLPDSLQEADRGLAMSEAAECLDSAVSDIDTAMDGFRDLCGEA